MITGVDQRFNLPPIVDTHIHLDFEVFNEDREEVIERAKVAGVQKLISIGAGGGKDSALSSAINAVDLANKYSNIFATVGVHPHDASHSVDYDKLSELASHSKVVAIGEVGLDFFRDWSPFEAQKSVFKECVAIAKQVKKPLIIHSREAGSEVLSILDSMSANQVGGVMHCYSENAEYAKRLKEINFYVSFTGSLTFKKADALREIAKEIPLDQILIETDAPYMAPEPYRGKRCESAYVVQVAKVLSELKGISFEECCLQLWHNTVKLFPQLK